MKAFRRFLTAAAACALVAAAPQEGVQLGTPTIFAPGVISGPSNDGTPAFTPDGSTLYFTRSGTGGGTILESHRHGGTWSAPVVAPFSGIYNDQHPVISRDGSVLLFTSMRPVPGIEKTPAHLWIVRRTATGWSEPSHLPQTVNIGRAIFAASMAGDGTLYFLSISARDGKRIFQLYRSRLVNGAYQLAVPLAFSTPETADVDPEIAPDQSFMIFASSGRRSGDSNEHLYIVRRNGDEWGPVMPLHYRGEGENGSNNDNEPRIARDGKTLYFSSDRSLKTTFPRTRAQAEVDLHRIDAWDNGNANIWSVPLTL